MPPAAVPLVLDPNVATHSPSPHPFDSACGCYVCFLHAINARFPFAGFSDHHLAGSPKGSRLLSTSCGVEWFACKPGELVSHGKPQCDAGRDPPPDEFYEFARREQQTATTTTPADGAFAWHEDPERRAKVLAAYVCSPYPKTEWENKLHVRPIKLVDFGRECAHSDMLDEIGDDWICDECKLEMDCLSQTLCSAAANTWNWHRVIDFDIIDAVGSCHELRMTWKQDWFYMVDWSATVRIRSSGRLVGYVDDSAHGNLITCLDKALLTAFAPLDDLPPVGNILPFVGRKGELLDRNRQPGPATNAMPLGEQHMVQRNFTSHEHQHLPS
ncbi:hypothetical protein BDZ88DRAFT_478141 [Geranomyces variabilis]|nr:hypothetical protein BDZ88DRAFT_478141 [Geranomyces variabilis]KAJ3132036.1 hypothetical protein HDU90_007587 [Geranomyces variabilis]